MKFNLLVDFEDTISEPLILWPESRRIEAKPLIPDPPTPIKCICNFFSIIKYNSTLCFVLCIAYRVSRSDLFGKISMFIYLYGFYKSNEYVIKIKNLKRKAQNHSLKFKIKEKGFKF
jgi:hypothetical protein